MGFELSSDQCAGDVVMITLDAEEARVVYGVHVVWRQEIRFWSLYRVLTLHNLRGKMLAYLITKVTIFRTTTQYLELILESKNIHQLTSP